MLTGATLAVDAVASRVCAALRDHSIPSIVLRGPGIRALLYDDDVRRWYDDIDLLVPPAEVAAAQRSLQALGFRQRFAGFARGEREPHSSEWIDSTLGIVVDLHLTIVGVGVAPEVLWERLSATSKTLELGIGGVSVPADPAQAMIVALHAAHHGARVRKPLLDLDRALALLADDVWVAALRFASSLDAVGPFAAGLRLRPSGIELATRLGVGVETDVMSAIRAQTARPTALGFARLAAADGWRERLAMLARKLGPTPAFMRHAYPIARRRPGGLALAYLWRPIVLLAQAGPGLLAWLRASRRVRGHVEMAAAQPARPSRRSPMPSASASASATAAIDATAGTGESERGR